MNLTTELRDTLTFVLAGGQGERLKPLTKHRAKPAVPFGGAYRIVDFTLTNCIHSGLRRIYVLTQYQAYSLEEHLRLAWNFLPRRLSQFIAPRPPQHGGTGRWYAGTADAIAHNVERLRVEHPRHVLILSGDHIYKMDYSRMLEQHVEANAACTIGAVEIPTSSASRFGILEVDARSQVVGFEEKPERGASEIPGKPGACLGSMGIYIFETEELIRRLLADAELSHASRHDFGKDILPAMVEDGAPSPTGATWGHSTRTTRRTSTCATSCRPSTCTTRAGPSTRCGTTTRRPRPSSTAATAGASRSSTRFSATARSSRARPCGARSCPTASTPAKGRGSRSAS
jgi:glucose-1-phosphate adenylyltransferase